MSSKDFNVSLLKQPGVDYNNVRIVGAKKFKEFELKANVCTVKRARRGLCYIKKRNVRVTAD